MNSPRLSLSPGNTRQILRLDDFDSDEEGHPKQNQQQPPRSSSLVLSTRGSFASSDEAAKFSDAELVEACVHFSVVGVGYLFPFSALTQPVDYWALLFPDFNIEFPLTTVYMYTNLACLSLLVFLGGTPDFTRRIVGGFVGQLLVLVFVPTSYFLYLEETPDEWMILGATAFAAVVTAFIDSSVISLAAQYPLRVQEYFQFGVGLSTLIGSIYRDVTKLVFPPEATVESSLLYFYSGAVTIALCILSYFRLMQLGMSKRCLAQAVEEKKRASATKIETLSEFKPSRKYFDDETIAIPTEASLLLPPQTTSTPTKQTTDNPNGNSSITDIEQPDKWKVLRKVFFNESMVLLLFMSTLALWPPLVTEIKSFNFPSLQQSGWWSLILLTVFSVSDCAGRLLVRFRMGITKDNIWMPVMGRFALFPLIICSVKGIVFTNDVLSVLFVGALGMTNGYVGTLSIVLINDACEEDEQGVAGTFTGFFLNSGLVLGATIGLVSDKLV